MVLDMALEYRNFQMVVHWKHNSPQMDYNMVFPKYQKESITKLLSSIEENLLELLRKKNLTLWLKSSQKE